MKENGRKRRREGKEEKKSRRLIEFAVLCDG